MKNKLGTIIKNNTIGLDFNLKHNLLADSNGIFYDEILNNNQDNLNNLNKNNPATNQ